MSDNRQNASPPEGNDDNQAVFKPSRWPGLIWAVPVAAVIIVAWLGLQAYLSSGPTVHVVFPLAGGLKADKTKVKYKGVSVGTVSSVKVAKSLDHMTVGITFKSEMAKHLAKGTRFWIAGNTVSFSNLSSLKALISGPFIGIDPRDGKIKHHFIGLGEPPVLKTEPEGETLTLVTHKLTNISGGSPVYYRNFKVGEVRGYRMMPGGQRFNIYAFIDKPYEGLVKTSTRFWDAGGVHVSTGGSSGPGLQIQSVPALIMGAVAFETPKDIPGQPVHSGMSFKLYSGKSAADSAPETGAVPYRVVLDGTPQGLAPGAAVKLEGATVGSVTGVNMEYDPAQGTLRTRIRLVLEPQKIALAPGNRWNMTNPAPQMNAMLNKLIGKGLRAEMGSSIPVVGGKTIDLSMVKGKESAALEPGNPPEIPSVSGGGSGQIMQQVSSILAKINAMPLPEIASNIHDVTKRIAAVSKSPQAKQTLEHLDQTMTHIDAITRTTNAQLPSILYEVKKSTADAQAALNSARNLMAAQSTASSGPESGSLPQALYELTRTARSLRELTNYLNDHPNSLLFGKGR